MIKTNIERINAYTLREVEATKKETKALETAIETENFVDIVDYLAYQSARKTYSRMIKKANKELKETKEKLISLVA